MSNNTIDTSVQILSNITAYMKYARYISEKQRRELWNENTDRVKQMHIKKFPELKEEIEYAFAFVNDKKVLPSMRSMQFAGKPIEVNPVRQYNCSYVHIDHTDVFAETMFLLLSGTGVGYSVQKHHIRKLPPLLGVQRPEGRQRKKRYLIGDSIEGWADAVKVLIESYFYNKRELDFDFRDIRPKGTTLITSGGKAPGPEPLRECLTKITSLLENAIAVRGRATKLTPLEAHDIMCFIADAVLSGGIRRAAMISLFSLDDSSMLECKFGNWWETNPQRGRANNSAVILRSQIEEDTFKNLWNKVKASRSGEPGFFMSNSEEWGGNPCMEISLRTAQMCNLVEVNFATVESQEDLEERTKVASFIATLQASYTDFHYLRDIWRETTEKEALIGVSLTGVASNHLYDYDLKKAAKVVVKENKRVAKLIGINFSARCTTNKPSGTSSIVLGTSSGVHAWYAPYYWRRIKVGKDEAIYSYLNTMYPELLEDDYFRPKIMAVIKVPQKAPDDGITRSETAIDSLERVKYMHENWIAPGHVKGINKNNVSCFSGDTKFLVEDKGYVSFNSFNDGDTVRVLTHDGTYTNAIVKNFGKQEIVELKVTTGGGLKEPKIIKTTKDHFWFVSNNYRRHSGIDLPDEKYRIIKTKNLLSIKKPQFPRVYPTKKVTEINLEGLLHGIVFGDGSRTPIRRKNGLGGFISLCHESRHLKKYFIEAGYSVKENDSINQTYIGKLPWEWKELPKTDNPKYIFSFIAGWFASDGYVSSEKRNVNITCIQEDAMKWLMDKAPICGISTSHTYSSYSITKGYKPGGTAHTINFIKESLPDEFFVHEKKLQRWLEGKPKTYQSPKYFSVLEINYTGKYEDVWCVIEPKNSAFVIEGNILTHNCTISIRDEEWEDVGNWMWENRDHYTGISVLPFDSGSYTQAPFEECTKEEYEEAMKHLSKVDLQYIVEDKDNTNLQGEIACGGGACEIGSV
jgi:ribonucleoside-diphosphate reductase alpha chain